jgi:multidrug efflux pump subunit AcrB
MLFRPAGSGKMHGWFFRLFNRFMDGTRSGYMAVVGKVGLACKTSVLIVEFAKQHHEEGLSIIEAAILAARIRFRPILMTALTTITGVFPLLIASGAGSASRRSLGTAVCGGMFMTTLLVLCLA